MNYVSSAIKALQLEIRITKIKKSKKIIIVAIKIAIKIIMEIVTQTIIVIHTREITINKRFV